MTERWSLSSVTGGSPVTKMMIDWLGPVWSRFIRKADKRQQDHQTGARIGESLREASSWPSGATPLTSGSHNLRGKDLVMLHNSRLSLTVAGMNLLFEGLSDPSTEFSVQH